MPLVSPHYAELTGFPPTLIHVGDKETLLNDSVWLAEKMRVQGGAGGMVDIKIWSGMWHVWQALGGMMREADASIAELGDFLKHHFALAKSQIKSD